MYPLRFLHIPKTAGTTFTAILRDQYFWGNIFSFTGNPEPDKKRYESLSEFEKDNIVLFTGHAPIVSGIKAADDATMITFIRDPLSRVKSFCQHVYEGKSRHLISAYPSDSFSLDDFLESGDMELSNLQTRMLAYDGRSPWSIEDMSTSQARDVALDNLFNRIYLFGLQELFDESLIIFSSYLNWKLSVYSPANKKNPDKLLQFEKRHIERILELNSIDIEVYRLAKVRFMNMLSSEAFDEAKLKNFWARSGINS